MKLSNEMVKVVVADDNVGIRTGLKAEILKSFPNAGVTTFSDAVTTEKYLTQNPYETDVLFLDVDFGPGASGLDVLENIRDSDGILPIVLLTGTTMWEDLGTACRLYGAQLVEKPLGAGPRCVHIESALGLLERLGKLRGTIDGLQAALAEAAKTKPDDEGPGEIADSEVLRGLFPRLDFSKSAISEMLACKDIRLVKALAAINHRTPGNGSYMKPITGTTGLWEARFSTPGRVFLRFHDNRVLIENIDPNHRVLA